MHRRTFLNTAAVAATASLHGYGACRRIDPQRSPYIPGAVAIDPAVDCPRDYWRAYEAVCHLPETVSDDERDLVIDAWDEISHAAYRTRPETAAGAYALIGVIRSRENGCVHDEETDVALATLHDGLPVPQGSFPSKASDLDKLVKEPRLARSRQQQRPPGPNKSV